MLSSGSSFLIGMATAGAIAAGFAGTFMDSVAKQHSVDTVLRPAPGAQQVAVASPSPAPSVQPSTSGIGHTQLDPVDAHAPPPRKPTPVEIKAPDASPKATEPGRQEKAKPKHKARRDLGRRKLEWYEDESVVAGREGRGSYGFREYGWRDYDRRGYGMYR
jgi:hypothetical protein